MKTVLIILGIISILFVIIRFILFPYIMKKGAIAGFEREIEDFLQEEKEKIGDVNETKTI